MPLVSVAFSFSQRFACSADALYAWATDYDPGDLELMGHHGRRRVRRLLDDTILLTDSVATPDGGRRSKQKLIRLFPERRTWTNTHVSGPNRHSQFIYEVVAEGRRARLDFTGRQLMQVDDASPRALRALARHIRQEDAASWRRLARAMAAGG
jgi:hypothetical protein